MVNKVYEVNASPATDTIDVLVAQSPVISRENGARLDQAFKTAIVDAYKKDFYKPQIEQYGHIYSSNY